MALRLPPISVTEPRAQTPLSGRGRAKADVVSEGGSSRRTQRIDDKNSPITANPYSQTAQSQTSSAARSTKLTSRTTARGTPSGDKKKKKKKGKTKPWWHLSAKVHRLIWFVASEAILATLIAVSLLQLNGQILRLYEDAAVNQLELMEASYKIKTHQTAQLAALLMVNEDLANILQAPPAEQQNRSSATYLQAFELLESELNYLEIEYAILLNSSGQIVVSGNDERQRLKSALRTGEYFDPGNLVQRILSDTNGTNEVLESSVILPKAEVEREHPPIWRERPFDYLPAANYHWVDRDYDCLVRFTVASIVDPLGDVLGMVVIGDVLNGKISVAYNVVNSLDRQGGFAGVLLKDSEGYWRRSSLYRRIFLDTILDQDTVADATDWSPASTALLEDALNRGGAAKEYREQFVLAARPVPIGTRRGSLASSVLETLEEYSVDAVLVRGVDTTASSEWDEMLFVVILSACVVFFLDLVMLWSSLEHLLRPLETIVRHLKEQDRVPDEDLEILKRTPLWVVLLTLASIPSVVLMILVLFWTRAAIDDVTASTAEALVGVSMITFPDYQSQGISSNAIPAPVLDVLLNPEDETLAAMLGYLAHFYLSFGKTEFITILDLDAKILASANAYRRGEVFDPHGIVSAAISSGHTQRWTTRLTYEEFLAEGPPVWQVRLEETTPLSYLSPAFTNKTSIMRYSTIPIDADGDGFIDGVMLTGDMVNGKTPIVERNLEVHGKGYEAIYLHDTDGSWVLATSVLRYEEGDAVQVDIDFSDTGLLDEALSSGSTVSRFGRLEGKSFAFAASPLSHAVQLTTSQDQLEVDIEVVGVVVYGMPTTEGDEMKEDSLAYSVPNIVIQFLTGVLGIWIAFEPVRKLLRAMRLRGFIGHDKDHLSFWALFWDPVFEQLSKCRRGIATRVSPFPALGSHERMEKIAEQAAKN